MSPVDAAQPIFYIIFGGFMALAGLHLWHALQKRFAQGSTQKQARSFAFMVHSIDQIESPYASRQPRRLWDWKALPPLEMEIARLVVQGKRDSEIARDLHLSSHAVETHLDHMYEKLEVRSRVELARTIRDLVD